MSTKNAAALDKLTPQFIEREYYENKRSTVDIGEELGITPQSVRQKMIRLGYELRSRSKARKLYLEENEHNTKGRTRPEEEKKRISETLSKKWQDMSEEEKQERIDEIRETNREYWDSMSEEEKEEAIRKMHEGNRKRAGSGSKNENKVAELLAASGYKIQRRTQVHGIGSQIEIDIYLPDEQVAIEWDGAVHFKPIFGEERLRDAQQKDEEKNETLIQEGLDVIRCRDHSTGHTDAFCRRSADRIVNVLENPDRKKLTILEME